MVKYSFVVPVFNRPDEVDELLASLSRQTLTCFEVVVVEDGSEVPCEQVCQKYTDRLRLHYYMKPNSGPGQSRNYGVERAQGEYVIILDSDVVLPEGYLAAVDEELRRLPADAFGGPDAAHPSFTPVQKAISYSMTSFFTTGGIRGGKKKLDKFYPRSFNMGIRREVYNKLNGFSKMRFGEDIDFSIRIIKSGFKTRLFPDAWVYHKRRTDFRKFWRQVFNSGIARINLYKKYPDSLKLVHLLPAVFTVGVILLTLMFLGGLVGAFVMFQMGYGMEQALPLAISALSLAMLAFYAAVIFLDANCQTGNLWVAVLSVRAAFIQLMGYGCGFIKAWWRRCVLGKDEFEAYKRNFYK